MKETISLSKGVERGCINTFSGKFLDLFNPTPEMIDISDIARGLSFKGHFAGQTQAFFSIAQHSLMVCDLIPSRWHQKRKIMMMALMHDAAEAYIGDMVSPLKKHLPKFKEVENGLMEAICEKFNMDMAHLATIKPYDIEAQEAEFDMFFNKESRKTSLYLRPNEALSVFMDRFWHYNQLNRNETT